jgi:hypothetical protein
MPECVLSKWEWHWHQLLQDREMMCEGIIFDKVIYFVEFKITA